MCNAIDAVKAQPDYNQTGEVACLGCLNGQLSCAYMFYMQWVITDARHDSTANAYHTTVPCLSGRYEGP